jgi:zinc transporter ZupT
MSTHAGTEGSLRAAPIAMAISGNRLKALDCIPMNPVAASSLLALFAASALVFGSILPTLPALRTRFFADRLSLLIGFSAGLMLATSLHELLPEALEKNPQRAMWGVGLGFLTLYVAERLTHFHACRHRACDVDETGLPADDFAHDDQRHNPAQHSHAEHSHAEHSHAEHSHAENEAISVSNNERALHMSTHAAAPISPSAVIERPRNLIHSHGHSHESGHADSMALVGMGVHNFSDGLTTAAAFAVSKPVGIVVVGAIVLHQMAAGLSLGAIMLRLGRARRRIWLSTSATASFIVWGALFYHFVVPVSQDVTGIVLGIAAGSFLYVAACDLLPEAHAQDEGWSVMAMTLAGYLFALAVTLFFAKHEH